MTEKRMDEKEVEECTQAEANDWFKWMLIAFLGFPLCAVIFVIAPNFY